jgi:hypothetical protein
MLSLYRTVLCVTVALPVIIERSPVARSGGAIVVLPTLLMTWSVASEYVRRLFFREAVVFKPGVLTQAFDFSYESPQITLRSYELILQFAEPALYLFFWLLRKEIVWITKISY